MTGSDIEATRFLATFLLLGGVVAGSAQSAPTLNALTLPGEALPTDCALKQPAPSPAPTSRGGRTVIRSAEWSPFPRNPWSGTDRKLVTEVRRAIDGTPRLPDGPPLEPAHAEAFLLKLADNVREAYHATYVSADGSQVKVWAVSFTDDTLAKAEPLPGTMNRPGGFRSRLVRGATVVVVTAPSSSECSRAVDGYIRSLKGATA